jgi:hypothetical protein
VFEGQSGSAERYVAPVSIYYSAPQIPQRRVAVPKSKHRRSGKSRPRSKPAPQRVSTPKTKSQAVTEVPSRRLNPETMRKIGWAAIGLAVVVFFQHLFSHMGFFTVFGPGADDLLIGYPTTAILILVGVWALGRDDR